MVPDGYNILLGAACALIGLSFLTGGAALARSPDTDANAGITAFVENCFSPFMTADLAAETFNVGNIRFDFYDLNPFSSAAPSTPTGRDVTPGTDRRCEVSFDLDYSQKAADAVVAQLDQEGITDDAPLPDTYTETPGTALLAARYLNPRRIAVVHVGRRPQASGIDETFLMVERLTPLATQ